MSWHPRAHDFALIVVRQQDWREMLGDFDRTGYVKRCRGIRDISRQTADRTAAGFGFRHGNAYGCALVHGCVSLAEALEC
jgi:hypothetical protein